MIEERGQGTEKTSAKNASSTIQAAAVAVGMYLELVLASLSGWGWVEEINCENLSIATVSFRASMSIKTPLESFEYCIYNMPMTSFPS
jgi:hypothetical protein